MFSTCSGSAEESSDFVEESSDSADESSDSVEESSGVTGTDSELGISSSLPYPPPI